MSIVRAPLRWWVSRTGPRSGSSCGPASTPGLWWPGYRWWAARCPDTGTASQTTATWQQLQVILPWIHRLFGDTVDVAAMINTTGEGGNEWSRFNAFTKLFLALKIHISLETKLLLDIHGCFKCEHRGAIDIKVKGFRCNVLCLNTMLCLGKGDGWLLLATFQRGRNIKAIIDR